MNVNHFFRRYVDNLYTSKDIEEMNRHLSSPEAMEQFSSVSDRIWEESSEKGDTSLEEFNKYKKEASLLLARIQGNEQNKKSISHRFYWGVGMVATFIVLFVVSTLYFNGSSQGDMNCLSYNTGVGEMKDITLPDGTIVTLNSCSSIKYPKQFTRNKREVELNGEAFLKVKRNENMPFIVNTQHIQVQVLGTCFNVKTYTMDENASVFVKSGLVKVAVPHADVYLQANEGISLNTLSGNFSKYVQDIDESSWREGILQFKDTPLKDVINELERLYGCKISYDAAMLAGYTISGEHENPNLESVLKSIEYTTKIKYKYVNKQSIELYK